MTRPRVLAVDDNPTNLAVLEEAMQDRFHVRLAKSGSEAMRIAPTFLPDVVLLDVMMPEVSGLEVCRQMKHDASLCHSQIIIVSAKDDIEDRLQGYDVGADDYVTKPFNEDELLAKISAAISTKKRYQDIYADMVDLSNATGEVLQLMSHLRDAETGEHIRRMREYSQLLAAELRAGSLQEIIDDRFLDDLYRASALHDLGKIAIPDSILLKAGPLTEDEWLQMQQHTVIGERILQQIAARQSEPSYFQMAAEIARSHHECFDGSGYPDGLAGDDIPLAARIVKVADVFDALTTSRVYKTNFSTDEARKILIAGRETQFDPVVIDTMLELFEEFELLCLHSASPDKVAVLSGC